VLAVDEEGKVGVEDIVLVSSSLVGVDRERERGARQESVLRVDLNAVDSSIKK
jgi:hypothetical protein